jgi:hypothetical protein
MPINIELRISTNTLLESEACFKKMGWSGAQWEPSEARSFFVQNLTKAISIL